MKKLKKDTIDYMKTGMTLGAGTVALAGMGAPPMLSGMNRMMPAIGTAVGATSTFRILKKGFKR